jgi:hypothetical protein
VRRSVGVLLLLSPVAVFAGLVSGYESIRDASFVCPSVIGFAEATETGYPGGCFLREAAPGFTLWAIAGVLLVLCAMAAAGLSDPRRGFLLSVACVGGLVIGAIVWFVIAGNIDHVAAIIGSVMWLFVVGVMSGWSGWNRRERVELPAAAVLAYLLVFWAVGRTLADLGPSGV